MNNIPSQHHAMLPVDYDASGRVAKNAAGLDFCITGNNDSCSSGQLQRQSHNDSTSPGYQGSLQCCVRIRRSDEFCAGLEGDGRTALIMTFQNCNGMCPRLHRFLHCPHLKRNNGSFVQHTLGHAFENMGDEALPVCRTKEPFGKSWRFQQ
eukprot:CAMPEP_0204429988 /NCGR_PEP_ID=MMETSP0470-20130426/61435_1 /ASSEMBLY_ACC=CAM_ASM_000385 /TAXON_ID=2969 /ORGANISM="Oxyrrhis marina" /LENGTH=150 /DNA_ID=CAMNT_0051428057 /DNA_START=92 /DNA_END=544 /DNA_ORIENTATION=-